MAKIILNRLGENQKEFEVVPLSAKRSWMNETPGAYAYRCVPMVVANTHGWAVINPATFVAEWEGDPGIDGIKISFEEEGFLYASSHFGSGILTIHVDFIIKTESGTSIFVRGIPNFMKDGIVPLDGIVETDWLPFTFTFNYKFTRPGSVTFEAGEPLFSFFPIERGFIEGFEIIEDSIANDPEFNKEYEAYKKSRQEYLDTGSGEFQRYYAKGESPLRAHDIKNHQKTISVQRPK